MIYIAEFEFIEDEGMVSAIPFDLEGGTCGEDLQDAVHMASDWLRSAINDLLIKGEHPKSGTCGHEPAQGGQVIAIAIDTDLNKIDAVTAADASRMLGVSTARVAQMCESGQLRSWRDGSKRMVLTDSIKARIAERPKAGRPRKTVAV